MVTHMKTTIEIADALLSAAKRRAEKEGSTLRALVEEGLRRVLRDAKGGPKAGLRRATFRGSGTRPEVKEGSWDRIRDEIYEGRGA
jgi:Arc/MetJ family transcription regulator